MISKDNKFFKFMKDKGFYVALAVCIVCASIGAFATARKTLSTIDEHNKQIEEQYVKNEVKKWEEKKNIIENEAEKPQSAVATETKKDNVKKPAQSQSQSSLSELPSESVSDSKDSLKPQVTEQKSEQSLYILPMDSLEVIEGYSNDELVKNETLKVWRPHNAIDFKGNEGDSIKAVSDGVIISIGVDPLWGGYIEIKHPDGCQSRYTGIKAVNGLKKGDNVSGGQKLGTLTDIPAENQKGIHLHFSMERNNESIDPGKYLPIKDEIK